MIKIITNNKLLFIIIHIIIGFLATFSFFPTLFAVSIIIICIPVIIFSKNKREEALLLSGYIVGVEVFLRMIKGFISYEMGKYGVMLFLITGMFAGKAKQKPAVAYIVYVLLLLLGIVFTKVPEGESLRKAIVFNLSGPILLGVATIYLFKRTLKITELLNLLFFMLLPIFSMVTYMYFKTPDLAQIAFGGSSIGETSGGFGPNQVVTILGFGIFVLAVFLFLRVKLTGFTFLDAIFLAYFTYRALLTFSRGGIITAAFSFSIFVIVMIFYQRQTLEKVFKYIIITCFFVLGVWLYTSDVTDGMINNRYTGRNANGTKKNDLTSGRSKVFLTQLESFYEAPLVGIGVGNGKYRRELIDDNITAASHNEVSRLIEEHGLIGIMILLLLALVPLEHFKNSTNYQRAFLMAFFSFWFLTINHSAMRIAFPGFIYALSLIKITDE